MRNISILFASFRCHPADFGGELSHCYERLSALGSRGHEIVIATRKPDVAERSAGRDGVEELYCPVSGEGVIARMSYVVWVSWLLLSRQFDVLHLGDMAGRRYFFRVFGARVFTMLAKIRGMRTLSVFSLADPNPDCVWDTSGKRGVAKALYYHKVDKIAAVSRALFDGVSSWSREKAVFLPYGIRNDIYRPLDLGRRRQLRKTNGLAGSEVVFVTIGSLGRRKGYDILAEAFGRVGRKHPEARLWIIGPKSMDEGCMTPQDEIEEILKPLEGVRGQVSFFGRVSGGEGIRELLGASDVFVFPTRREGMPISPMEAMSMSLPVIASHLKGVTDVATVEGETGFLVAPGDVDALEEAMSRLVDDQDLRKALGAAAQRRVDEHFGWEQHIDRWELLYAAGRCEEKIEV